MMLRMESLKSHTLSGGTYAGVSHRTNKLPFSLLCSLQRIHDPFQETLASYLLLLAKNTGKVIYKTIEDDDNNVHTLRQTIR